MAGSCKMLIKTRIPRKPFISSIVVLVHWLSGFPTFSYICSAYRFVWATNISRMSPGNSKLRKSNSFFWAVISVIDPTDSVNWGKWIYIKASYDIHRPHHCQFRFHLSADLRRPRQNLCQKGRHRLIVSIGPLFNSLNLILGCKSFKSAFI